MKLKNASRYFDTCPVYDGYTGSLLFKVQASTFMEAAAEGSVSVRRTISLDPTLDLPSHSVITVLGERYVTGEINSDEWKSEAIRKTCWTKKVSDSFRVGTVAQLLAGSTVTSIYGHKRQTKEVNTLDSSNLENFWEASISVNSGVAKSNILKSGPTLYRVRFTYVSVDGFLTCGLDQLQYTVSTAQVASGKVYNPVTDTYLGSTQSVNCLPVDYKIVYDTATQADYAVQQGDISIYLPSSITPSTGMQLSLVEPDLVGNWQILNFHSEGGAWCVHARRL